jgi:hypothetical protein
MELERIVTHGDFDGVVSAAICSRVLGIDRFFFTGPSMIERSEVSITAGDVVCDLPYPLECGLWFDHHPGNREALALRGIDPLSIPGRLDDAKPSCARVIFEYFGRDRELPPHFSETVAEADTIDSFDYRTIDEWRRETPGKLVDMSMKTRRADARDEMRYLDDLVRLVRDRPLAGVAADGAVAARAASYRDEEKRMIEFIEKSVAYLPQDAAREIALLDFTSHARPPRVHKNLAYLVAPQSLGVLVLGSVFRAGRKTNDLAISMSLSMNLAGRPHGKDLGEIMRRLNIGDGHAGAASGTVRSDTKDAMLRAKKRLLSDVWKLWAAGSRGGNGA